MAKQTLAEKKAALEAELAEIKKAEKAETEKMEAIIGRLIMEEGKTNTKIQEIVRSLTMERLVKNSERELFGLQKLPSKRGRPSS